MSNQNNRIILNDILNYVKNIDNDIKLIKEEIKQNSNDIKFIKDEVKQNSNDIKLIKEEVKQIKKYINKNSKYNS